MEEALKNLFDTIYINLYSPLLSAFNSNLTLQPIYDFLENLINSILNMFGNNANEIQITFTNELVVSILSNLILILLLFAFIKLLFNMLKGFYNVAMETFNKKQNKSKEWRSQWKRKK